MKPLSALTFLLLFFSVSLGNGAISLPVAMPVDAVTADSATLAGFATLNGKSAKLRFEYRQAGTQRWRPTAWLKVAKGQQEASYEHALTGLTADTDYEFRAVAVIGGKRRNSETIQFRSAPPPAAPTFISVGVTNVTVVEASIRSVVSPNGLNTSVWLEWGLDTGYGISTKSATLTAGNGEHEVVASLTQLVPGATYYFRLRAENSAGTNFSEALSFTMPAIPPTIISSVVTSVTATDATIRSVFVPNGLSTEVSLDWGTSPAYGLVSIVGTLQGDLNQHELSAQLGGLTTSTTYFFRLRAQNWAGTNFSETSSFTTPGKPSVCDPTPVVAVVTNCNEADLRAAIRQGNVIQFASSGTIRLTGAIEVGCDLTLDGTGQSVAITGSSTGALLRVVDGALLTLNNLSFNGATAHGVAYEQAVVSVYGSVINVQTGSVSAANCSFSDNTAIGGDNPSWINFAGSAYGGAIFANAGTLRFTNCWFTGNAAIGGVQKRGEGKDTYIGAGARGGALSLSDCDAQFFNCVFERNKASGPAGVLLASSGSVGGALAAWGSRVTISHCLVTNNAAGTVLRYPDPGGAVYLSGSVAEAVSSKSEFHRYTSAAMGGAVFVSGGSLSASRSQFTFNRAEAQPTRDLSGLSAGTALGGAIALSSSATATLDSIAMVSNTAVGAFSYGIERPDGSGAFPAGQGLGGGLYCAGTVSLTNCVVAANHAVSGDMESSAMFSGSMSGKGGGIANENGTVFVEFSTVASNTVAVGDGHLAQSEGAGIYTFNGSTVLLGSVLAGNVANGTNALNVTGGVIDDGYNISSDASAELDSAVSWNTVDPLLGPLTWTGLQYVFPLLDGSPAIDAFSGATAPVTDIRGVARPQGIRPDIGSFERN